MGAHLITTVITTGIANAGAGKKIAFFGGVGELIKSRLKWQMRALEKSRLLKFQRLANEASLGVLVSLFRFFF